MGNTRSISLFWGKVANSTNIFGVQFPEKNVKRLLLPTQKKQDRGNIFQLLRLLFHTFFANKFPTIKTFLHICCQHFSTIETSSLHICCQTFPTIKTFLRICCQHFSTFETSYRKEGEQTNCGGVIDCLGLNLFQKRQVK